MRSATVGMPNGRVPPSAFGISTGPMMGVFNNLVMYKQDVPLSSLDSIVPDLATEWSWEEDRTALTFKLRQGVKWHDGKPFTANDVKCTWDMLQGKTSDKLRLNPRKAWYLNLDEVVTNGDYEVTFRLPGALRISISIAGTGGMATPPPAGATSTSAKPFAAARRSRRQQ